MRSSASIGDAANAPRAPSLVPIGGPGCGASGWFGTFGVSASTGVDGGLTGAAGVVSPIGVPGCSASGWVDGTGDGITGTFGRGEVFPTGLTSGFGCRGAGRPPSKVVPSASEYGG